MVKIILDETLQEIFKKYNVEIKRPFNESDDFCVPSHLAEDAGLDAGDLPNAFPQCFQCRVDDNIGDFHIGGCCPRARCRTAGFFQRRDEELSFCDMGGNGKCAPMAALMDCPAIAPNLRHIAGNIDGCVLVTLEQPPTKRNIQELYLVVIRIMLIWEYAKSGQAAENTAFDRYNLLRRDHFYFFRPLVKRTVHVMPQGFFPLRGFLLMGDNERMRQLFNIFMDIRHLIARSHSSFA
ncbi:MAG: hypothetical protein IJ741_03310 [Schwartzia sp.]|nr:hypothetical protein [Schwartzia sp. (in: firmicutes)]